MNKDQVEIVIQYLNIETNYAIIITGDYGAGKTHFYKNELVPKIKDIPLSKDASKKHTPIHISLFGFKSIEEIQTAIFFELFPILKSKGIKLAAGIGKSIIRGMAQFYQAGDIDKYIGDLNQDADTWLKYDELVICFDDLDRKSDSLVLTDVIGFINSLVENQGAKILIIANKEQLIKDKDYSSILIEKVIGVSIPYVPDLPKVYLQIIRERYSSADKIYFKFLEENSIGIIHIIEKNKNNFRNLIFFLEHFKIVFYQIDILFGSDKDFAILKAEKLKAILDFTLAISIEYKLGFLNYDNFEDVKTLNETFNAIRINKALQKSNGNKQKEEKSELSYFEQFKSKYFSNNNYYFFKSIFEYITGTKSFQGAILKIELEDYFIVKDGIIPECEKILKDLEYLGCLNLTDKEYRKKTNEMLVFVDQGIYKLRQYATVFHYATRFNNILNFNIDKLKKRFKKGIKKGKQNFSYNEDLKRYLNISHDTEFKVDVTEIIKFCFEINDSLKKAKDDKEIKNLFEHFSTNFNEFIDAVNERDNANRFLPFWLEFDIKKIIKIINKLENEQIWNFGHYFNTRFAKNIFEPLFPEKKFIIELRELIDRPTIKRKRKNLHNVSLDFLSKCLKECENNFPIEIPA